MVMAKENTSMKKQTTPVIGRRKQTRIVSVRMLIVCLADVLGICLLSSISADSRTEFAFVDRWLMPLTVVFAVLSAAALVYQILAAVKKWNVASHYMTPAMMLGIALFCLAACLVYKYVLGTTIVLASVIATVLFLVYYLYMHVFYR